MWKSLFISTYERLKTKRYRIAWISKKNPIIYQSFGNAIKYADEELQTELETICGVWIEKYEEEQKEENYKEAKKLINFANSSDDYAKAIDILSNMEDYNDCKQLIEECRQKSKDINNQEYSRAYDEATKLLIQEYDNEFIFSLANKYKAKYGVSKEDAVVIIKKYEKTKNYFNAKQLLINIPITYKDTEYKIKQCEEFLINDVLFEKEKDQIESLDNEESEQIKEEKKKTKKVEKIFLYKLIPIIIGLLLIVVILYGTNFSKSKAKININSMDVDGAQNPNLIVTYSIKNNSMFGDIDYLYFTVHVKDSSNNEIGTITTSLNSMNLEHNTTKTFTSTINYQYNNDFYNKLCAYGTNLKFEYEINTITFGD